ncbi:hypothetical protein Moror_785 [Moniliophthora roreri MCA 2997]|uniref:C2H2-type domain-containing protein n=2 Tax=Moniliophthora roreri TaxID=221103 RepID=V2X853_MONRO|nr:hypothetical protein Moror_785 [Moniliophthora roreri MCA 2997]KAI3612657.1 hypothetical protein WG66_014636 [Moniliophthora roreri]
MSLQGFGQSTSLSPRSANPYDSSLNVRRANQRYEECFHCFENHPNGCDIHRTVSLGYSDEEPTARAQLSPRGYSGHRYQGTEHLNRQHSLTVDIPKPQGAKDTTGPQSSHPFSPTFSPTPSTASVATPRSTASYKPYGGFDPVLIHTSASPLDFSGSNLQYGGPPHIIQDPTSTPGFRMQVGSPAAAGISKSLRTKDAAYFCPYRGEGCSSEGFTEKHNLNYHINSHLGIKPHVCLNCRRGFGSKSDLARHLKAKSLPCGNTQTQTISD